MEGDIESVMFSARKLFENNEIKQVKNIHLYEHPEDARHIQVMRYNSLKKDLGAFFESIGVSNVSCLPHLKEGMSDKILPIDFFTREQLNKINDEFFDEFNAFGYEMI